MNKVLIKIKQYLSEKALNFGLKYNKEYFNAKVEEVSQAVARKYIDLELRKHRILHCIYCNSREQLMNIDGNYLCKNHANMIKGGKKNG